MNAVKRVLSVLFLALPVLAMAQVHDKSWKSITENKDEKWFATDEAAAIAENVLLYQRNIGGWPKNIQMQDKLTESEKQKLTALKSSPKDCTTDNGATTQEMLFLSKMYKQRPEQKYKDAFEKGLEYLLEAQYKNGGWPQYYPLKKGYYTHITYNDDSMVRIMTVLKEVKDKSGYYAVTPCDKLVKKAETAFNKGVECILKTQYRQNGVLTAWCAQHDEETLLPAKARAYELPSLSGKESAKITLLLMSIENPSPEVKAAVEAAVAWFEKTKINGIKIESVPSKEGSKPDKVVVESEGAEPLWARFMELEDNTPFFCDRDGVKKATMAEIGYERRSGYGWYSNEPKEVLKKYSKWKNGLK
ncbi:MAG: pectate lyase [Flavobacterium sp.]